MAARDLIFLGLTNNADGTEFILTLGLKNIDVVVALTGVPATGAVGTVDTNNDVDLSGVEATGSVGTLDKSSDVELPGVESTGEVESPDKINDVDLSGVLATSAVGTIRLIGWTHLITLGLTNLPVGTEYIITVGLTNIGTLPEGVEATAAVGSVTQTHEGTVALTGVEATTAVDTLQEGIGRVVSGVEATGNVGIADKASDITLSGVIGTSAVESPDKTNDVDLSGIEATVAVGNIGFTEAGSVSLSGVEATGEVGTPLTLSQPISGIEATGAVGTILAIPQIAVALTGIELTGDAGTLDFSSAPGNTNVVATTAVGNLGFTIAGSASLIGVEVTGAVDTTDKTNVVDLTGVEATSAVDTVTFLIGGSAGLTGVQATVAISGFSIEKSISGVEATSAVGSLIATPTVDITNILATSDVGTVDFIKTGSPSLGGIKITAQVGSVLTVGGISALGVPVYKRDTNIYISKSDNAGADETNTVEILVKDFSFNKSSLTGVITKQTLDGTDDRGVRPHIKALSPVSFSFTTYINPLVDTNVTSPEEYLWVSLMGSDILTSNPTSSTIDFADGNVKEVQNLTLWFDRPTHSSGNYRLDNAVVDSAEISFDINQIATIVWNGRALSITEDSTPPASTDRKSTGCLFNKLTTIAINVDSVNYTTALTGGNIRINNNNTFYGREQIGKTTVPVGNFTGSREVAGDLKFYFKVGTSNTVDLYNVILDNASADDYEDTHLADIIIIVGGGVAPNLQINLPQTLLRLSQQEFGEVISLNVPFTVKEETGNYISVIYKA